MPLCLLNIASRLESANKSIEDKILDQDTEEMAYLEKIQAMKQDIEVTDIVTRLNCMPLA